MRKPGYPGAFNFPHYTVAAPRGRRRAAEYGKRPKRNAPGVYVNVVHEHTSKLEYVLFNQFLIEL